MVLAKFPSIATIAKLSALALRSWLLPFVWAPPLIITVLFASTALSASTDPVLGAPPLISVSSVAEKSIEPTMVVLQIESYGKAKQAKQAQELQAKEYARIKIITDKFKIKKEDFSTQNYNIQPEYSYDQKAQLNKVTGYRASHNIKLILRKVDSVGDLIDALTSQAAVDSAGVSVQSIEWDSDKKNVAESAAMADAVKIAKQKAEELAAAAGVKVKSVYSISHNSNQIAVTKPQMEMTRAKALSFGADSAGTEVNGQSIKVRAEVTIQFQIKD